MLRTTAIDRESCFCSKPTKNVFNFGDMLNKFTIKIWVAEKKLETLNEVIETNNYHILFFSNMKNI